MPAAPQTYANHVHQPWAWSVTWVVSLLVCVALAVHAYQAPDYVSFSLLTLSVVVLSAVTLVRAFALRLQNRIIRLEMQVRLARLGHEGEIASLALPQLIALRFASDAELLPLIERTLAANLTPDEIKRAVKDWQGDYLRT